MGQLLKNINIRKCGSIMVDAAISLPLFIISMAMLLEIINIAGKEENAFYQAETRIQMVGSFGADINLGVIVDDPENSIYIDHVQVYPIIKNIKFPFAGAFFKNVLLSMDMPYRTFIGESPDIYGDTQFVYIFPKNEGNEKTGPKYHTVYCSTMKGGETKGLEVTKVTKTEAEERGYTLCKHCAAKSKDSKTTK